MRVLLKVLILCLFVSFFSACIIEDMSPRLYLESKDSCGFALNQYTGEGVRWDKSEFPVSFYIHESVPYSAKQNFLSAIEHWNIVWEEHLEAQGLESFALFDVVNKNTRYSGSPGNDSYNMLFFETDDFSVYEEAKIQAITAMSSTKRGGIIKDTDIIVNNVDYSYFYDEDYNEDLHLVKNEIKNQRALASSEAMGFWFEFKQHIKRWFQFLLKPFKKKKPIRQIARKRVKVPRNQVDFPSLMIHELGHVPGLAHFDLSDRMKLDAHNSYEMASKGGSSRSKEVHSVMEPKLAYGRARRDIEEYDLNNLLCGYLGL